jgi:hypothetical protein
MSNDLFFDSLLEVLLWDYDKLVKGLTLWRLLTCKV